MKCIYCSSEENMTVSDIIPWAITGAKVQRQFVCKTHNAFTNDQFERKFISDVGFFRNQLGLTERFGDPVKYTADLIIDGHTIENERISDRASVIAGKRMFSQVNEDGEKTIIGATDQILKISGSTPDKIEPIDMSNIVVRKNLGNLNDIFISNEALHTVAKIGYEWHCYINNLDGYDNVKFKDIVDFILDLKSTSMPVDLVVDAFVWQLMDRCSRMGSNMLYEYDDADGNTYVVFGLWNILIYRIKICSSDIKTTNDYLIHDVYFYNTDKTAEKTVFGVLGRHSVHTEAPRAGLDRVSSILKNRLLKLEERSITTKYIDKNIRKIEKVLPAYEAGSYAFEKLIDYEDNDRLLTIFVLEKLLENKEQYNENQSFEENIYHFLNGGDMFPFDQEKRKKTINKYINADQQGSFSDMLKQSIQFFHQVVPDEA